MKHSADQRIADCHRLYLKYNGKQHEQIEREMREIGHARFRRRVLYARNERGRSVPGWIERFGWKAEPPASAGGSRMRYESSKGTRGRHPTRTPPAYAGGSALRRPSGKFNHSKWRRQNKPRRALINVKRGQGPFPTESTPTMNASNLVPFSNSTNSKNSTNSMNSINSTNFKDWLISVSSHMTWDAAHHKHIIDTLERVTSGECNRLMIFMPPRHGKSELVTVRYAAWRMKQKPETNIIIGSYNQRLANRFSRKIKTVLCEDMAKSEPPAVAGGLTDVGGQPQENAPSLSRSLTKRRVQPPATAGGSDCPFPFVRPRFKNSESEWETRMGGGLRAVGVGSGVTGFGANLIIVDDPVKSRAEAESIKYRERVHDWFNDDLYTRLEPDGQIILIQTRWHEDDLAGRLLAEENGSEWEVINLPALAERAEPPALAGGSQVPDEIAEEQRETFATAVPPAYAGGSALDILGRSSGEALWPARFSEEHLENTKHKIGTYSFASLYQQHPVPAEGGLFKREWFTQIIDRPPHGLIWKRGYDLGITANATSDYTASYRVAYDKEGNLWIDGGYRSRIEYPDQRRYVLGRIRDELDTEHGIEDTANGSAVVQELRKEFRLQGRAFRAIKPKGDKAVRAAAWINLASEGKLRLVRAGWNKEFIDEACAFPKGAHDDQIDAVSIAVAMHAKHKYGAYGF